MAHIRLTLERGEGIVICRNILSIYSEESVIETMFVSAYKSIEIKQEEVE